MTKLEALADELGSCLDCGYGIEKHMGDWCPDGGGRFSPEDWDAWYKYEAERTAVKEQKGKL